MDTAIGRVGAVGATEALGERTYRNRVLSWAFYDWADHAYITTLASTFFPPYFIAIAGPAFINAGAAGSADALARDTASNVFAFTVSLALFVAAILAPIVGAYADITGARKKLLVIVTVIGGLLSSAMFVLTTGLWFLALALYFVTQLAMNIALGLSSSLLPHVARPNDVSRVSSLGYAMGYFGGGLLLLINTALFLFSDKLGIPPDLAVRIAFLTVGVWWILFTIPLAVRVPEPAAIPLAHGRTTPLRDAFTRLGNTLRDIRRYRELFNMLIAFWFYMEGIGAIILLATAYGAALSLGTAVLIGTLLMTQFVAFPYALLYGRISNPESRRRGIFVSMLIWTGIPLPLIGAFANITESLSIPSTFALITVDQIVGVAFSVLVGRRIFSGLAERLDPKRAVILGLVIYTIIPVWGFFLRTQAEFFIIGWIVGTVQRGHKHLADPFMPTCPPKQNQASSLGYTV